MRLEGSNRMRDVIVLKYSSAQRIYLLLFSVTDLACMPAHRSCHSNRHHSFFLD